MWRLFLVVTIVVVAVQFDISAQSVADTLWLGTHTNNSLSVLNTTKTGTVIRALPPRAVSGIAVDVFERRLFLGSPHDFEIHIYDLDTLLHVGKITQVPEGLYLKEDMAFDGTFLYRCDPSLDTVVKVEPIGLSTSFIKYIGGPMGVAWSGKYFYVSVSGDYSPAVIREYNAHGFPTGREITPAIPETPLRYGGLAWDNSDGTLWLGAAGDVYHIHLDGTIIGSFAVPDGRFVDGLEYQRDRTPPLDEPTLDTWAYIGLSILLACVGTVVLRRHV